MKNHSSARSNQRGVVLALFVIGMVAIIALAGLALDMSHAYVDKTGMQNALDAAALSGAMTLIKTDGACNLADNDATDSFDENVLNTELNVLTPTIEFSETLQGAYSTTCPSNPRFVRAKLREGDRFSMKTWFARVLGSQWNDVLIAASAVAGPANAEPCNLTPLVVCADPADDDCEVNGINTPGTEDDGMCFGYKVWEEGDDPNECYLKTGTGGGSDDTGQETGVNCGPQVGDGTGTGQESDIGPGNFQLLDLSKLDQLGGEVACDGGGASFLRCAFCKDVRVCAGTSVPTKPGNTVGPVAQGINTNFNEYTGAGLNPIDCPADTYPTEGLYSQYLANNGDEGNRRRIKSIAIGDCTATSGGQGDVPIKTVGCFFLTQKAEQGGAQRVWGQFVGGGCSGTELTTNPSFAEKIILYKDYESIDS